MADTNPFLGLRGGDSVQQEGAVYAKEDNAAPSGVGNTDAIFDERDAREKLLLSYCIERVFLVTLDNDINGQDQLRPPSCVFLEELYESLDKQEWLDMENMSQAMFSRTLMSSDELREAMVVYDSKQPVDTSVSEQQALIYLFHCYLRAGKEKNQDYRQKCEEIILQCSCTCLREPDLYPNQNIIHQLIWLFFNEFFNADSATLLRFLTIVLEDLCKEEGFSVLYDRLSHLLKKVHAFFMEGLANRLCSSGEATKGLKIMLFFIRNENLAKALVKYNESSGPHYEKTLFGSILSSSIALNSLHADSNHLFDTPSRMTQSDLQRAESQIFINAEMVVSSVYEVFMGLCRVSGETRKDLLHWIGRVLSSNYGRVRLAATMSPFSPIQTTECSDGFMLNLSSVLLKMCEPFSQPQSPKLLKIQPVYCRHDIPQSSQRAISHYCTGLKDQTFLIPLESEDIDSIPKPEEYGFVTNLFFLTQLSLYLGLHATYEKFTTLNRELTRIQQVFLSQQRNPGADFEAIKVMFEGAMRKYFAMKALLTDPTLLRPVLQFNIASSTYLTYLATGGDNSKPFTPLTFPISDCNTHLLGCMPEFALTVITDAMLISKRLKQSYMQELLGFSGYVMDLVLVFMGSKERVKSPHLRAELASVLHELMPKQDDPTVRLETHDLIRERLFTDHPNIEQLSEVLFKVFVSIETTGESVQFEQKLSYRQPMYKVIDYIWKIEKHQRAIMELCSCAMKELDNTDPPLFLKFTNLLVNDAHFLLDEALDYMKQIKEKEMERTNRQAPLQGAELQRFEADLSQMTMLARFHNTAAVDTTHTLALLTSRCSELFCHDIMLERIVAMLNYFLLKLTGPKMSEFKVSDFQTYEFKPDVVVSEICQIYLNLSESEVFCQAVCADGRSYSPKLFSMAERVLIKIHKPHDMIQAFIDLAAKITAAAERQTAEEDLVSSAPDEYLDPLTGNLMKDPVTLPSSQVVMDKSTIARHLLSDQTDPYNRSPLTLDQVIPNTQLKQQIDDWIKSSRKQ